MKHYNAEIKITLREGILDVQGKTVEHALSSMNLNQISHIRIGKYISLAVEAESEDKAYSVVNNACRELLANPIMEDFEILLREV